MPSSFVRYNVTGLKELLETLSELPEGLRNEVARPAVKEGADIFRAAAEENAVFVDRLTTPNYIPGNIKLVEKVSLGKQNGAIIFNVGVKKNKRGVGGGNTYYWWWLEFGSKNTRPKPMLRKAWDENKELVFRTIVSSAGYQLIKYGKHRFQQR